MPRTALSDDLFDRGHQFDFFQAVRLVEAVTFDHLPPLGPTLGLVDRIAAAVRVRALPSLSFPTGSVSKVTRPAPPRGNDRPVPDVVVNFFGLYGPSGTLPVSYTQAVIKSLADRDVTTQAAREALRDWFDLFNSRFGALLYAGWEKYRFPVGYARYARMRRAGTGDAPPPDPFTRVVKSLVGLETPGTGGRFRVEARPTSPGPERPEPLDRIDDLALLRYAGILARRPPTAVGLETILADYFGVRVSVEEMTGQWLSVCGGVGVGAGRLGVDVVAGERMWSPGSRFRVNVGPLRFEQFREYLPDRTPVRERKAFFLLSQLIRFYVGPEFDFEIRLGLLGTEVPPCRVEPPGPGTLGARLGWTTWLPRAKWPAVVDDVRLAGDPRTVVE